MNELPVEPVSDEVESIEADSLSFNDVLDATVAAAEVALPDASVPIPVPEHMVANEGAVSDYLEMNPEILRGTEEIFAELAETIAIIHAIIGRTTDATVKAKLAYYLKTAEDFKQNFEKVLVSDRWITIATKTKNTFIDKLMTIILKNRESVEGLVK